MKFLKSKRKKNNINVRFQKFVYEKMKFLLKYPISKKVFKILRIPLSNPPIFPFGGEVFSEIRPDRNWKENVMINLLKISFKHIFADNKFSGVSFFKSVLTYFTIEWQMPQNNILVFEEERKLIFQCIINKVSEIHYR